MDDMATWASVVATVLLVLVTIPLTLVALHQARAAKAARREAQAAQAEAEAAAEAALVAAKAAQTTGDVRIYAVGDSGSPARHHVTFNNGNVMAALDPHDRRSLRLTRRSDPVVISDDTALGQTVSIGIFEVPATVVGVACGAVTVGCALALVTDVVHSGIARLMLIAMALAALVPALRILPNRIRHRHGAVAIGHAGVTVHRRGDELHLAWIEIGKMRVDTMPGRRTRAQISLAPAVPGAFNAHKSSGLLRVVSRRPDESLVSALIAYSHAIPLRGRARETAMLVTLVDASLERFASDRYVPSVDRILPDEEPLWD